MNTINEKIKAIRFESPEYIPMSFHINDACWNHYDNEQLYDLMESHPLLFPDFKRPSGRHKPEYALVARKDEPYLDDWGCLWETSEDGITGTVTKHPIRSWEDYKTYKTPDPSVCTGIGPMDWNEESRWISEMKDQGDAVAGGLRHGHTFLQLCDIRGYENLIFDMYDQSPGLMKLIEEIEHFNTQIIKRYAGAGVDLMCYPEDLGMQIGPMLSPDMFRQYIKPSYQRMMKIARDKGIAIHMHSDGDLHDLIDDLIEGGVEAINLQDLVNDVDWIAGRFAGKVCVDLDIDRQKITPKGTPEQIDELIGYEVKKLGSKQGGLMMTYGLYPGVPIGNVKAVMDAMEKYAFYYRD